jgi:3-oxoisoapionate decarboxylase
MFRKPATRRSALKILAAGTAAWMLPSSLRSEETKAGPKSSMGLVLYCCQHRREHLRKENPRFDLFDPRNFLKHCQDTGAGGAQLRLGTLDIMQAREIRKQAEELGLYLEAIVTAPQRKQDVERFELEISTAMNAGAKAARTTIIPGRRYEFFSSLEMFNQYDELAQKSLEWMAPVAEKHMLPVAVENHKDHRDDERVALFKKLSSEYIGACVDTGNSFALLEDPIATVEKFAPWAHSVHLKDQAFQPYEDGFLLADIPLGQGGLDLKRMVGILQKAKPDIRFTLELITRDPLKVPCLMDAYWRTFPDLPAKELARTLRYVRDHQTDNLQYISKMPPQERLAREEANIRESLAYARDTLGLRA